MNSTSKVPKAAVLAVKSTTHPPGDGWISLRFGDEVSKKSVGSEKTQADVCGLGELPQGVRESKIFCAWSTIYQGHHNLKGSPHRHIEEKKSPFIKDLPGAPSQVVLVVKNLPANAGDTRDASSIPGSGRSPGGGHGNPLQDSCLENPMDRGAWWATAHKESDMTEVI